MFDEIVLSTSLMNEVISLDETAGLCAMQCNAIISYGAVGVLVCQSGCVLETLDNMLADKGLMMPLDLGAKGR